jgi:hypothetical protein
MLGIRASEEEANHWGFALTNCIFFLDPVLLSLPCKQLSYLASFHVVFPKYTGPNNHGLELQNFEAKLNFLPSIFPCKVFFTITQNYLIHIQGVWQCGRFW